MTIGERVAAVRKEYNLNQNEFSKRLSISQSHLSNVEKGKKEISASMLKLICLEFLINEKWLLSGEGEMYNHAALDTIGLDDAARGKNPMDKYGFEKSRAIEIAAWLYSIFPNVAASCVNVEFFLMMFGDSEFCELFNAIATMYQVKLAGNATIFDSMVLMAQQFSKMANLNLATNDVSKTVARHDALRETRYLKSLIEDELLQHEVYDHSMPRAPYVGEGLREYLESQKS